MSLYSNIRAGLLANLSSLGLQGTGYLMASPLPPTVEIFPGRMQYDSAMARGFDEVLFLVRITVDVTLEQASQDKLDSYLDRTGSMSVKTLLESDRTLGGTVKSLRVEEATGHQVETVGAQQMLSASWTVRVVV